MVAGPFQLLAPQSGTLPPDFIRDPTISADCFRRLLKTYLLDTSALSTLEGLDDYCGI